MKNSCLDEYLTPDGLKNLECLAREYRQNYILARVIGIGTPTLYNWRKKYTEIRQAFDRGRKSEKSEHEVRKICFMGAEEMAKAKYEKYLTPLGLLDLEELSYSHRDDALAKIIGITPRQLSGWRRSHIEINDAIEKGRARAMKVTKPLPPVKENREVLEDMLAWCDGVMA